MHATGVVVLITASVRHKFGFALAVGGIAHIVGAGVSILFAAYGAVAALAELHKVVGAGIAVVAGAVLILVNLINLINDVFVHIAINGHGDTGSGGLVTYIILGAGFFHGGAAGVVIGGKNHRGFVLAAIEFVGAQGANTLICFAHAANALFNHLPLAVVHAFFNRHGIGAATKIPRRTGPGFGFFIRIRFNSIIVNNIAIGFDFDEIDILIRDIFVRHIPVDFNAVVIAIGNTAGADIVDADQIAAAFVIGVTGTAKSAFRADGCITISIHRGSEFRGGATG